MRDAPMGHGARRIILGDFGKLLLRLFILERMEQSDTPLEELSETQARTR